MHPAPVPRHATLTATNLFAVIKQQGRSQAWLGRHLGVSRFYASLICNGRRQVTPEVARRSSDLLGVPVHLLFEEADGVGADAS